MKRSHFRLGSLIALVSVFACAFAIARYSGLLQDGIWSVTEVQMLDYTRPDVPGIDFTNEYIATCRDGRRTINLVLGKTKTIEVGDSFHFAHSRNEPNAIIVGGQFVVVHSR